VSVFEQVIAAMDAADTQDVMDSAFVERVRNGEGLAAVAGEIGEATTERWCEAFGLDLTEALATAREQGGRVATQGLAAYGLQPCKTHRLLIEGMCGGSALIGIRIGLMVADELAKTRVRDA
jgi:hypothetical protein